MIIKKQKKSRGDHIHVPHCQVCVAVASTVEQTSTSFQEVMTTAAVTWCDASSEREIGDGRREGIYGNRAALPSSVVPLSVFVFIFQDQSSKTLVVCYSCSSARSPSDRDAQHKHNTPNCGRLDVRHLMESDFVGRNRKDEIVVAAAATLR